MEFSALKDNIFDTLKEFQYKIGRSENAIGLYYTPDSLAGLLDFDGDFGDLLSVLADFAVYARQWLGEVKFSFDGERYCIKIPKEGVKYVQNEVPDSEFLKEFIALAGSSHGATIEDVLEVFRKYSNCVKCVEMENSEEFDYLVYFENGQPDSYRYCIQLDMGHVIYHRFTAKDYSKI
jgi:hypothetical protein